MRLVGYFTVLAMVSSLAFAQPTPTGVYCGAPMAIDDGWQIDTPENVKLDGALLCGIADRLNITNENIHAVVIARHGKLVFEQYFKGYDAPWGEPDGQFIFDSTTKHDMRSVSKSVTSLIVGIAIDRRLIRSADEPVTKFFEDYSSLRTKGWENITLRHLLTMSSGIKWDENLPWTDPRNDEPHLGSESDPIRYVLAKPIAAPPDADWNYNGGGPDLLASVIERVSGKSFDAFAREVLFQPLGITDWEWKTYPKNGKLSAAAGLRLRPRDAAKIGQLMLAGGRWNDQQIVSPEWVERSMAPRIQAIGYFGGQMFYGYLWWHGRTLSGGRDIKWIAAMGQGGQRIIIIPDYDLVVVTTSGLYASPQQGNGTLEILYRFVLPAIRDEPEPR
jgi:CubicO group peptidase (beta-lactamase class C family)